jgi:hypothetical protein
MMPLQVRKVRTIVKVKITFIPNDTSKEIIGRNGEYSAELKPNSKDNSDISFMTGICTWVYVRLKHFFYIDNDR